MTYRSMWCNGLLASSCAVFVLVGVAMLLSSGAEAVDTGGRVLGLAVALLFGTLAFRAVRAGITVTDTSVVVRSVFRTHKLAWDVIDGFQVGGSWSVVPWQRVTIERTDGTTVTAAEVASLPVRHPTLVERVVESLNLERERYGPNRTT